MNTMLKRILFSIVTLLFTVKGYADSPLTSTLFYTAYLDVPIVKVAAEKPGKLTEEMMQYLHNEANPLDRKLALINAIGYDKKGGRLSTFPDYIGYCIKHFPKNKRRSHPSGIVTSEDIYNNASPHQWAVLVYIKAMSDYSAIMHNYSLAERAMQNPVSSESFMLPMALVWTEGKLFLGDIGNIYPSFEYLFGNAQTKDMRPKARQIILEYINSYKKYAQPF